MSGDFVRLYVEDEASCAWHAGGEIESRARIYQARSDVASCTDRLGNLGMLRSSTCRRVSQAGSAEIWKKAGKNDAAQIEPLQ